MKRSLRDSLRSGARPTRSTTSLEEGVADAADDLGGVGGLLVGGHAVLVGDQAGRLGQGLLDLGADAAVLQGVVDGALLVMEAVVGGGGVARVDRVELALDEGLEVVDPAHAVDGGLAVVGEGRAVDDPLEERLELDVEAGVGVLGRHDAVDGRVGVARAAAMVG